MKTARNHELDTNEEEMVRGFIAILRSGSSASVKVEDVKRLFRLSPAFNGPFFAGDDESTREKIVAAGPRTIYLSGRELSLLGEGPLSSSDSERMLAYLAGDEQDPSATGPVPWSEPESRPTLPAPIPATADDVRKGEIAQAMQAYLASNVAMLLFSKLTLYRAIGENPKVVVTCRGMKFRVHIERVNGEKEHFNRDGEA